MWFTLKIFWDNILRIVGKYLWFEMIWKFVTFLGCEIPAIFNFGGREHDSQIIAITNSYISSLFFQIKDNPGKPVNSHRNPSKINKHSIIFKIESDTFHKIKILNVWTKAQNYQILYFLCHSFRAFFTDFVWFRVTRKHFHLNKQE
jgi:hypothetical protein